MLTTVKNWIKDTPLEPPAKFILKLIQKAIRPLENGYFVVKNYSLKDKQKI